jgi:hypothetical protein
VRANCSTRLKGVPVRVRTKWVRHVPGTERASRVVNRLNLLILVTPWIQNASSVAFHVKTLTHGQLHLAESGCTDNAGADTSWIAMIAKQPFPLARELNSCVLEPRSLLGAEVYVKAVTGIFA